MTRRLKKNTIKADRLFHSVERTWKGVQTNTTDVKELIPEFYQLPSSPADDFCLNHAALDLGVKQDGVRVNDVLLPPWAKGDARLFHQKCVEAIESEYASQHLPEWIDLIFGFKQQGVRAEEANNVYSILLFLFLLIWI